MYERKQERYGKIEESSSSLARRARARTETETGFAAPLAVQIVRLPQVVQRTRPPLVHPHPRLALPAPVEQAHRTRVERPAAPPHIVAPEAVLVPPVVDRLDVPTEHQQERRQRPQLVYPPPPLHLHPPLDPLPVAPFPPPREVHHHHPRVEVARLARPEGPGQDRVGPEAVGEVLGEVGVAVLGGPDDAGAAERGLPEVADIVYDDEVRVEVDDPVDAGVEDVAEVVAGVVEWVLEGLADGGGDQVNDGVLPEDVDLEVEGRESGADEPTQDPGAGRVELRGDKVEEDVLGAGGVAEDRVDGGDGAAQVLGVEGHGDVDEGGVAGGGGGGDGGAALAVTVLGGLGEPGDAGGSRKRADGGA
ncbi:Hexosyltransferase [Psidium guajava]|nr:Hexosyltransferase [Psidium guajava]